MLFRMIISQDVPLITKLSFPKIFEIAYLEFIIPYFMMEIQISQVSAMLAFCYDWKQDSCTFIVFKNQPNPTFSIKQK
jgi:hypothetical protein